MLFRSADLLRQQQILLTQEQDRAALEQDLQEAVRRYQELKAAAAPATEPVPPTPAG